MLNSARRVIPYPNTDRSDRPDVPAHILNLVNALDVDVLYNQGTDAARTAAVHQVNGGRFWWTTDTLSLWYDDGTTWRQVFGQPSVPPGVLAPFVGAAAPAGWLLCDGSAVSRTTYSTLFAVIASVYGGGDGSTTFNVPDLRGRIPVGKNAATFGALAATGGEETHVLTSPEMPSHTHVFTGAAMAAHSHTFTGSAMAAHTHAFAGSAMSAHSHTFFGAALPDHQHFMTAATYDLTYTTIAHARDGGTTAVTDVGQTTGAATTGTGNFANDVMGGHVTSNPAVGGSLSSDSAGAPSGTNSSVSAGTPAGTMSSDSAGTPSGTNANTGGGGAHNNLQPYIVTNYIIKT